MARNVLLITVDQWRGDCLGVVGHPVVRTPNLDRLADEGVLFRRHYAQAVPCGPSRASLHTGQYLMKHRSALNGTPLDARFTNLALEARAAGYDPVLFGYTDASPDPRALAVLAQAFDTLPIREGDNLLANHVFIELRCAIEDLGG